MDSMAPTTDSAHRWEVHLEGGLASGLRNDPEGPMIAAVRTASDGGPLVEIEIDPATSGFHDIAWLTAEEAVAYAHAILRAAEAAARITDL